MLCKVRVQRHLVVAHKAEDDGEWVFTLCRRGLEKAMGRRLYIGDTVLIELDAKLVSVESKK